MRRRLERSLRQGESNRHGVVTFLTRVAMEGLVRWHLGRSVWKKKRKSKPILALDLSCILHLSLTISRASILIPLCGLSSGEPVSNGSHPGVILSLRNIGQCLDNSDCHNGRRFLLASSEERPLMLLNISQCTGAAPKTINYLAQNVSRTNV